MTPNSFLMGCYYPEELRGTKNKTKGKQEACDVRHMKGPIVVVVIVIIIIYVLEQAGSNIFH